MHISVLDILISYYTLSAEGEMFDLLVEIVVGLSLGGSPCGGSPCGWLKVAGGGAGLRLGEVLPAPCRKESRLECKIINFRDHHQRHCRQIIP
jgi:hypothetical protein